MANRTWQWVATVALVIALLVTNAAAGSTAVTVAAVWLGLAWLAERVPDQARFWPAHDLAKGSRSVLHGCVVAALALVVALVRR